MLLALDDFSVTLHLIKTSSAFSSIFIHSGKANCFVLILILFFFSFFLRNTEILYRIFSMKLKLVEKVAYIWNFYINLTKIFQLCLPKTETKHSYQNEDIPTDRKSNIQKINVCVSTPKVVETLTISTEAATEGVLWKFCKIHRKTPVPRSLFLLKLQV